MARVRTLVVALALVAGACAVQTPDLRLAGPAVAESTKIFAGDGSLLTTLHADQNRETVPLDQMPKQLASGLMFGTAFSVAVPDVDRTDYLLMLGANPLASNGSLLTASEFFHKKTGIRACGSRGLGQCNDGEFCSFDAKANCGRSASLVWPTG